MSGEEAESALTSILQLEVAFRFVYRIADISALFRSLESAETYISCSVHKWLSTYRPFLKKDNMIFQNPCRTSPRRCYRGSPGGWYCISF